jgi:hypothetical protein
MIAVSGHIAIIIPNFAQGALAPDELGVYEYLGSHKWADRGGPGTEQFLHLGMWG